MKSRNQTAEWLLNLGSTPVSVFSGLETSVVRTDELPKRKDVYGQTLNDSDDMTLDECLAPSKAQCETVNRIRKAKDRSEAALMRRGLLPEICISATLTSRIRGISEDRRIVRYNSLVVLNIQEVTDPAAAKMALSGLPFVFYAGLDTFGTGLDVIVPVEASHWREHEKYFYAVKQSLEGLGFKVSSNGASAASTIYLSYDSEPYRNRNCKAFSLQDVRESDDPCREVEVYRTLKKYDGVMKAVFFS